MAEGLHWEWRGFGGVSARFERLYSDLPDLFDSQKVEDLYLWIPGLEVNAKFRTGAEGGLKFKRIQQKAGELEKWLENPEELFDFPLSKQAWQTLSDMLMSVDLRLSEIRDDKVSRVRALNLLKEAGCRALIVKKNRESVYWNGPNGKVKVEWASISEPQSITSIGLENFAEENKKEMDDDSARDDLLAAIDYFQLNREPLQVMNYLEAVERWAHGGYIG